MRCVMFSIQFPHLKNSLQRGGSLLSPMIRILCGQISHFQNRKCSGPAFPVFAGRNPKVPDKAFAEGELVRISQERLNFSYRSGACGQQIARLGSGSAPGLMEAWS